MATLTFLYLLFGFVALMFFATSTNGGFAGFLLKHADDLFDRSVLPEKLVYVVGGFLFWLFWMPALLFFGAVGAYFLLTDADYVKYGSAPRSE